MFRYAAHVQVTLEYETDREIDPKLLQQDSCQMLRQLLGTESPPQEFVLDRTGVEVETCKIGAVVPAYVLSLPLPGEIDANALYQPHGENALR